MPTLVCSTFLTLLELEIFIRVAVPSLAPSGSLYGHSRRGAAGSDERPDLKILHPL